MPATATLKGVLEIASIRVREGSGAAFEAAMDEACQLLQQAHGFRTMSLNRVLERPDEYQLLVEWDSVEAHMTGFQKSDLFTRWRVLLGGFFSGTPVVCHTVQVMRSGLQPVSAPGT